MENNLKKLSILLQAMETDHLSRADFEKAFKSLVQTMKRLKAEFASDVAQTKGELSKEAQNAILKATEAVTAMKKLSEDTKNDIRSDSRTTMRLLNEKVEDFKRLIPEEFDDSELKEMVAEVRSLIPELPDMPESFDPTEIVKDIKDLEEMVKELKERPVGTGGGVTNARIIQAFKYILKTEAPVGDIDGANTTYTVTGTIFAVLAFSLNGEVIAQLPNYTIAGRTITFSTALPAVYSGKDFQIKYV